MVTLDTLILHLENLKELHGHGEIPVTVPIEKEDCIEFVRLEQLSDVHIFEVETEKNETVHGLYLDVSKLLVTEEDEPNL